MKRNKTNYYLKNLAMSSVALAFSLPSALAQQTSTIEWSGTTANWSDASSWSTAILPALDDLVGIENGGSVTIDNTTPAVPVLEQLRLGGQSILDINDALTISGTDLVDNDPDPDTPATGLFIYSNSTTPTTVNINDGGSLTVDTGGNFRVAKDAGDGFLNLATGGTLTTDREVWLGDGQSTAFGKFTMTGGTLTHTSSDFRVGPNNSGGEFAISGGTATINKLRVKFGGNIGTQEVVLNHTGGDVTYTGESIIGQGSNASATYNMSGGTAEMNGELRIGSGKKGDKDGGQRVSTFNQTGGSVITNVNLNVGTGALPDADNIYSISGGDLTANGRIQIGALWYNDDGFGSSGVFSVSGTGYVAATNVDVGDVGGSNGGSTGTLEVSDGTFEASLDILLAPADNSTGIMNLTGGATTADDVFVGSGSGGTGTLLISGGTLTTFDDVEIGNGANSTGTATLTGGTLTADELVVGLNSTSTSTADLSADADVDLNKFRLVSGSLTQSGNSTLDTTDEARIGGGGTGATTYNMVAGTLTTGNRFRLGVGNAGAALFNQTGGDVNINGRLELGEGNNAGTVSKDNTYQISGGTLTTSGTNDIRIGWYKDGEGTFNISGTAEVFTDEFVLGFNGGDTTIPEDNTTVGTANLNGGTLTVRAIKKGVDSILAEQTLNLNGGTIKARGDGATGIENSLEANLLAGGVIFEVPDASWDTTTTGLMTGVGSLTKTGPGTLLLNNENQAYTGGTNVNEGCLLINTFSVPPSIADTNVAAGAGFGGFVSTGRLNDAQIQNIVDTANWAPGSYLVLDTNGEDVTVSADIVGNIGIIKKGAGELNLAGANTYTGETIVEEGTVVGNIPADDDGIVIGSVAKSGDTYTINFTSSGLVDVYRSTDLQTWGAAYATDQASPSYVDTAATAAKLFYVLVPAGQPYP